MVARISQWLSVVIAICGLSVFSGCGGDDEGGGSLSAEADQADKIADPKMRAEKLVAIAAKQRKQGDVNGANNSISKARVACDKIARNNEADWGKTTCLVASALFQANRRSDAEGLVKTVRDSFEEISDAYAKVEVVAALAEVYGAHMKNQASKGEVYLASVEDDAKSIQDANSRTRAFVRIAGAYHQLDAASESQRIIDIMVQAANELEDLRKRGDSLVIIAEGLAKIKMTDEADELFDAAKAVIDEIESANSRGHAFVGLARAHGRVGQSAKAQEALEEARQVVDKVEASMRAQLKDAIDITKRQI